MSLDTLLSQLDLALKTLSGVAQSGAAYPAAASASGDLSTDEKKHSIGLMRVNQVGEVCAQALYQAQSLAAQSPEIAAFHRQSALEETAHLAWCNQRLRDLGGRASWLNPLWYAGSFALGYAASRAGDATALGFVVETERQVEAHLASHLEKLPAHDAASRAIVAQMQADEAAHANAAQQLGAAELPAPIKAAMQASAKLMTSTAYYV